MKHARLALILTAPMLLVSCLLTPGQFTSTLDIKRDRSFTFTYAGEVILLDPTASMNSSIGASGDSTTSDGSAASKDDSGYSEESDTGGDEETDGSSAPAAAATPAAPAVETAEKIAERRATGETLAKEAGYRSVEYLGNNKFRVDYSMSGKLDRGFVYPINTDIDSVIPWIAVETRRDGTVRVKAMAFGENEGGKMGEANPTAEATQSRQGTFTLTTDADLVMQNNEEGLTPGPGKKVVWRVTPTSKTVPTAVLRFAN